MSKKQKASRFRRGFFVRMKGLEPPRREAPDPKSGAATNYATSAALVFQGYKYTKIIKIGNGEVFFYFPLENCDSVRYRTGLAV